MIYWTVFLSALVMAAPALAHNPDDLGKAAAASVVTVLVILVMFHAGALRMFRGGADGFRMNYKLSVDVFESGVLYRDGVFERLLPPGEHWIKPKGARLLRVDMRPQVFQIAQGVMTADRTRAVLRSVVRVQIKDARAAVESATDYRAELFAQIQSAIKKQAASWILKDLYLHQAEFNLAAQILAGSMIGHAGAECIAFELLDAESSRELPEDESREIGFRTH